MSFADYARRRTKTSLDALLNQRADSARHELDALRAACDQGIAAFAAFLNPDESGFLEALVEDLSRAALEQAEAAAARARLESQEAAHTELVAVQVEAQARLDAELASHTALQEREDEAHRQVHRLQHEVAAIQAARAALEAHLEQEQTAQTALADAEREAETLRQDVQERAVSLAAVEARLHTLEGERTQLQQRRDEAEASLDMAVRERMALAEALGDVRKTASLAKAETESYREELEAAAEQVKEAQARIEAEIHALRDERRRGALALVALDRVQRALQAFDAVTSPNDLLETFLAQLGHDFARAAIFLVRGPGLEGWRSVGLDPTTDITNLAVPLTVDSLLTRAVVQKVSATLRADPDGVRVGLFGSAVACAIAVPVLADGRVVAVAYGEQTHEPGDAADAGLSIADILGCYVSRCLTAIEIRASAEQYDSAVPLEGARSEPLGHAEGSPLPSARPTTSDTPRVYPGPTRQAPRVRMPEGIEVLVDSSVGVLVDLSSRGAQVLSPKAMRPNYTVRMILPRQEGALQCNGRIVWAMFEVSRANGTAQYRAGVQFTEIDARAVHAFLMQHGWDTSAPSDRHS